MKSQSRLDEPSLLREGVATWTASWINRQQQGKPWRWPVKEGQPINRILVPILKTQTAHHCSFCDSFPIDSVSIETIEHFKPKSRFPEEAFHWSNLFYCCTRCQDSKREDYSELLLKPDAADYNFSRYFFCDFTTGILQPNPQAPADDQLRALITLQLYGLNSNGRPEDRKRWIARNAIQTDEHPDDRPYRFLFSLENPTPTTPA